MYVLGPAAFDPCSNNITPGRTAHPTHIGLALDAAVQCAFDVGWERCILSVGVDEEKQPSKPMSSERRTLELQRWSRS